MCLNWNKSRFRRSFVRKNAPVTKIIKNWNRLHIEVGKAYSLEVFRVVTEPSVRNALADLGRVDAPADPFESFLLLPRI